MRNDRPQSEVYREAAMRWQALDAAARLLEDTKSAVFSQRCLKHEGANEKSQAAKETAVRASDFWMDYVRKTVNARSEANKAKIDMDYERMRGWERQSQEATERQELRMTAS